MADALTWPLLRERASFRAEKGCATTLCLNLDPSEVPTAGDAQTRMNALLNAAEKTDRTDLTHEQRGALKADFARIARWLDDDFDRARSQGLAVFAAGLDNFWSTMPLPEPVPDKVKVGRDFQLAPLVPLVARADGTIVAVVGRGEGPLFRVGAGRLQGVIPHLPEKPRPHDPGGRWPAPGRPPIAKPLPHNLKS